ncbi:MAG: hypothetical protein A2Z30_07700 [Chloroflexi bacterium RBG_16_64_43]|nr:MAG: hypothetical protein A2Z30_07700 [Chloroflexi bacterium RBG_16_64_43]
MKSETSKTKMRIAPWLVLFFLAPAIGELLSGSSPPAEFFSPFGLTLLCLLYGAGAILVRELTYRWGGGWRTVLLLGAAYAIIEEGLMVKSWFDPGWMDLGVLGDYGRFAGVNWVWAAGLTVYHTVYSIGLPILLTTILFPARRDEPWVDRRGLIILAGLLAADVAVGYLWMTPYRPPAVAYLLAAIGTAVLIWIARRTAAPGPAPEARPLSGPWRMFILGLGWAIAFFIQLWALPNTRVPVLALLALLAAFGWASIALGKRLESGAAFNSPRHLLALASGVLTFFILLAPLQEMDPSRADNTAGMSVVGATAALFLLWIAWRLRIRPRPEIPPRGMF